MKLKFMAAAIAALAISSTAHATIGDTSATNADLVLLVGTNDGQTYARNLGLLSTFLAGDASTETFNAPTGSIYSSTITGTPIFFGLVATDGTNLYASIPTSVWTGVSGAALTSALATASGIPFGFTNLDASYANANGVEYTGNSGNTNDSTNAQEILSLAAHGSLTSFTGAESTYTESFSEVTPPSGRGNVSTAAITGSWTFNTTTGAVVWDQPSAVPLPAAAWFLGSGLLGLVGIGRRRSNAA